MKELTVSIRKLEREINRREIELSKLKVNHILHLLLSILTAGLWIILWVLITLSVSSKKPALVKAIAKLENQIQIIEKDNR